jgi:hypothetical protein
MILFDNQILDFLSIAKPLHLLFSKNRGANNRFSKNFRNSELNLKVLETQWGELFPLSHTWLQLWTLVIMPQPFDH